MSEPQQWILAASEPPPEWFISAVKGYVPKLSGYYAAQLLWQRSIRDESQLAAFVNYKDYQPASPLAFGQEMQLAVERLMVSKNTGEKIAIWGDFDADGITATSVLWDGLGQFFPQNTRLFYYIPNRLTESHGLNNAGIERLAHLGCKLIVTCDTGSTNISEIEYAQQLGIDIIVTDHHTLPSDRPPVTAIINPRYLPKTHQLFHLSGVAVAYKLVEALYQVLPNPPQPLTDLLDLVAIGLIADLVQLSGDCRYLAQLGIERLRQDSLQLPVNRRRPGVGRLLELCQKNGDRPTDISFGLGPRINAVSRIQGDASFCVELLTSRDQERVNHLAQETELANSRRKSLQKDVQAQVQQKLAQLDLSTTSVIVLADPQWAVGVLGLVAGQIAQETGRPTILLSLEGNGEETPLARGSARSVAQIDLYQLVKDQSHLLHRFGGHPFAAGLSLPVENIPLFTQAINQRLRQSQGGEPITPTVQADLVVTVADLGKDLFFELKILEPCGMGNPTPKLLIQNCWVQNAWHRNQQDSQGKKVQYIKAEFDLRDNSTNNPFPGIWWGHYKDELPAGRCDCIVELDYNAFKKRYEIRIIAIRQSVEAMEGVSTGLSILDWRDSRQEHSDHGHSVLMIPNCPTSWDDIRVWIRRSLHNQQPLAIAWSKPHHQTPSEIWLTLVGIAIYLDRTQQLVTRVQLQSKLLISDRCLFLGIKALNCLGFLFQLSDRSLLVSLDKEKTSPADAAVSQFLAAVQEEQFQQQYFAEVPLSMIVAIANQL